jgi:hypothetical protein
MENKRTGGLVIVRGWMVGDGCQVIADCSRLLSELVKCHGFSNDGCTDMRIFSFNYKECSCGIRILVLEYKQGKRKKK